MDYFKEELSWYWQKRMYVYPFKSLVETLHWGEWRNIKDTDYEERLHTYATADAVGLYLVTGKKGMCGVSIKKDKDAKHSLHVLQKVLMHLQLPEDYSWILATPNEYIIIVDVVEGFNNADPKNYTNIRIVWEEGLQLPIQNDSSYPVQYKGNLPQERPMQVHKETIFSCIGKLDSEVITNEQFFMKKAFIYIGKVILLFCLFALVGALPVVGIPAIIVFFMINWDKIFKNKKEKED